MIGFVQEIKMLLSTNFTLNKMVYAPTTYQIITSSCHYVASSSYIWKVSPRQKELWNKTACQ